jgi:signal transduction histidine kinase
MLQHVRDMAFDLRPAQLDDFGLYAALREHCTQQANAAGWVLHFDPAHATEWRPHRDVELACFRLVQEALNNVALHADATEVWVSLSRSPEEFLVSVRDNGVGFDAVAIRRQVVYENLGLLQIEERVRQVAGRVEIDSHPGRGTEIRARFRLCSAFPEQLCDPADDPECASCFVRRTGTFN